MLKQKVHEAIANMIHQGRLVDGSMQTTILGVDTDLKVYKREFGETVELGGKAMWATKTQTDPIDNMPTSQRIKPSVSSIMTQTDFVK